MNGYIMDRESLRWHCEAMCKKFRDVPYSGTYGEHRLVLDLLDQTEWIPVVSGELPKEPYACLVTVWDTDIKTQEEFENVLPYPVGYDGETWNDGDGNICPFEVIAWQPFPKPYKIKVNK